MLKKMLDIGFGARDKIIHGRNLKAFANKAIA